MTANPWFEPPIVEEHDGIFVVRDDLLPGGSKLRYLARLFEAEDEVVYATPAYGGAQIALAQGARLYGKKATLFVAKRTTLHERTAQAQALGAKVVEVPYGYLTNVQAKAKRYCKIRDVHYLQFGARAPEAINTIAAAAAIVEERYGPFDQVWSAAGSGVLSRSLQQGVPGARVFAVAVGAEVKDPGRATVYPAWMPFGTRFKVQPPFPSCPYYDAKAWYVCRRDGRGRIMFWNVLGDKVS